MSEMSMRERLARAIAGHVASAEFDQLHRDKRHWTETGGMFDGQYRDVNEPRQDDLLDAADAVLAELRTPTEAMVDVMLARMGCAHLSGDEAYRAARVEEWQAVIAAASLPHDE